MSMHEPRLEPLSMMIALAFGRDDEIEAGYSSGRALRCTKLAASTGRTEGSSDRLPFSRSVVVITEFSTELLGAGVRESSYWS